MLEGPGAVLDAEGGPGVYSKEFLRRGHRVIMKDLPEVLEHVVGVPYHLGQTDIELIPGDLQEGLPLGSFDAIYLSRLGHMFGPEENRRLFQDARKALRDGGFLVIVDWLAGTGIHSTMFAVNMLLSTRRGSVWSLKEYEGWLEEAGFRLVDQAALSTGDFLIVAISQTMAGENCGGLKTPVNPGRIGILRRTPEYEYYEEYGKTTLGPAWFLLAGAPTVPHKRAPWLWVFLRPRVDVFS